MNETVIKDAIVDSSDILKLFNKCEITLNGNPVAKLFSNRIIRENNLLFFENLTYNEDKMFVLEYILLCKSSIVFSSIINYNYVIHVGSLTTRILSPESYLTPYIYFKNTILKKYGIPADYKGYTVVYENFKIYLHMYMNAALLKKSDEIMEYMSLLDNSDWDIYKKISKKSNLRRRLMDFFIFREIYFIPCIITRVFFNSKIVN